jgi:hypothetical protein
MGQSSDERGKGPRLVGVEIVGQVGVDDLDELEAARREMVVRCSSQDCQIHWRYSRYRSSIGQMILDGLVKLVSKYYVIGIHLLEESPLNLNRPSDSLSVLFIEVARIRLVFYSFWIEASEVLDPHCSSSAKGG